MFIFISSLKLNSYFTIVMTVLLAFSFNLGFQFLTILAIWPPKSSPTCAQVRSDTHAVILTTKVT